MPSVVTLADVFNAFTVGVSPIGALQGSIDPQILLIDTFDGATLDTTNRWTTGGTVIPTLSGTGALLVNPGTAANASSSLVSQVTFPPSYQQLLGSFLAVEAGTIALGNHRFFGFGTQPGSWTAATPLQDAVGLEFDTNGILRASVWSGGAQAATQALSIAKDGNPHRFGLTIVPGVMFVQIDGAQVFAIVNGLPSNQTLPIRFHSINGGATTTGTPIFVGAATALVDFCHPSQAICDGTFSWRKQTVGPRGDAVMSLMDGNKTSYSCAVSAAAGVVGDTLVITGSATKTVRVTRISFSGTATAAEDIDVTVIKRSTADTGGTGTAQTIAPHDSTNAAPTAVVTLYTAAPTPGTSVGTVRAAKLFASATGTAALYTPIPPWDFGNGPKQGIVLRGVAQQVAINLSAASGSFDADIEWTEE